MGYPGIAAVLRPDRRPHMNPLDRTQRSLEELMQITRGARGTRANGSPYVCPAVPAYSEIAAPL